MPTVQVVTIKRTPTHLIIERDPRERGDLYCGDINVDGLIGGAFSWPVPGAFHRQKYHREKKHPEKQPWCRECNWDGKRSLYDQQSHAIPQGFLPMLTALLDQKRIPWQIADLRRPKPEKRFDWTLKADLREEYQVGHVEAMIAREQGIVQAATGGGKSIMAAAAVCQLGLPAVIVVPTKLLAGQFIETFEKFTDIPVGRIASGKYEAAPVQVAVAKSLVNNNGQVHPDLLTKDVLIIDEMHYSAAATWEAIINGCGAHYRFGFSATPYRKAELEDNMLLGFCGDVIASIGVSELQELGYLAETEIRVINIKCGYDRMIYDETEDDRGEPRGWRETTYAEKYNAAIAQNGWRNLQTAQIVNYHASQGEKVLVIISRINHAEAIMALMHEEPIFLTGMDNPKQTEEKRLRFRDQQGGVCIGTSIVDTGFDVPAIDVLVMAGGGEFDGRTIQKLGRGLRPSPGKEKVIVYDIKDDDRPMFWYHGKARIAAYQKEGQQVTEYESFMAVLKQQPAERKQLRLGAAMP